MRNHKQMLADFYLELLALPEDSFIALKYEVLKVLADALESDIDTVKRIFERMASEDGI